MKYLCLFIVCMLSLQAFGQNPFEERFNKVSDEELLMSVYSKDPSANAVVLYENAKKTFGYVQKNGNTYTTLHYYAKVKILSTDGLEEGNIVIPFAKDEDGKNGESVINIKAITHNINGSTSIENDKIITAYTQGRIYEKKLLLPNVKVGSVIEYQYTIISPYTFTFRTWYFQSNIPKIHSEFNAKIPLNYRFLRSLKGKLKLDVNDAHVLENCFRIEELDESGSCEVFRYVMKDVPAFKKEKFALSYENYISRIEFKLAKFTSFRILGIGSYGGVKTWEEFDKSVAADDFNVKDMLKKGMFKSLLPKEIKKIKPQREKAQKVYTFIRNHYQCNGNTGGLFENNLRKAFRKKEGSVSEINLSLMNAMHAVGIHAEILLIATRSNSIPTQEYPVMSDFNHLIVKIIAEGNVYFLDATDKNAPFGILPLQALNYKGRALDFVAESYWETIVPNPVNRMTTSIALTISEDGVIQGKLTNMSTGHIALDYRNNSTKEFTEEYLNTVETEYENLEITDYKMMDKDTPELPLKESFEFEIDKDFINNVLYLDPFIYKIFPSNPFELKKREYPVDFAYSRMYTTRFLISLPPNYQFENLPKDQTFQVGDKKSICKLTTVEENGKLNMTFTLMINEFHYLTNEYETLKSFFNDVIKIQKNTLLTIRKKNS